VEVADYAGKKGNEEGYPKEVLAVRGVIRGVISGGRYSVEEAFSPVTSIFAICGFEVYSHEGR